MPRSILRHHLPCPLQGLALGVCALSIGAFAASAPSSATADQSRAANDQSLPEVTVIGKMDAHTLNHVVNQFIQSHAKPSAVIGQVGRWAEDVCPDVSGLQDVYAGFVTRRIGSLARSVGAPAPPIGRKCAENVQVVFTDKPQAQLDYIAGKYPVLLGYFPGNEIQHAKTFRHPVQAWYVVGSRQLDGYQPAGGVSPTKPASQYGPPSELPALSPFTLGLTIDSISTSGESEEGMGPSGSAGSYLTRGLRSEILHVLIIVDNNGVSSYSLQSIADYIALLTLTRIASQDACTELPSILNLFTKDCSTSPAAITASDSAYLKALYSADLDTNLNIEQGDMRERMVDVISTQ
jgi:hypothetical protein